MSDNEMNRDEMEEYVRNQVELVLQKALDTHASTPFIPALKARMERALKHLEEGGRVPKDYFHVHINKVPDNPENLSVVLLRNTAVYPLTEEEFEAMCSRAPVLDDLERANCQLAGAAGHAFCGLDPVVGLPRFVTGNAAELVFLASAEDHDDWPEHAPPQRQKFAKDETIENILEEISKQKWVPLSLLRGEPPVGTISGRMSSAWPGMELPPFPDMSMLDVSGFDFKEFELGLISSILARTGLFTLFTRRRGTTVWEHKGVFTSFEAAEKHWEDLDAAEDVYRLDVQIKGMRPNQSSSGEQWTKHLGYRNGEEWQYVVFAD